MWLTLDSGTFKKVRYNTKTKEVEITLDAKNAYTPYAYLRVDQEVKLSYEKTRDAFKIPLKTKEFQIKL